jgi:superfamily II RNA helicase
MAGRAGRRCLDKEGNVIFIGYSWDRIKELSKSSIPNIIVC